MDEKKLIRCFIAIEFSREVINEIKEIQNKIKRKFIFNGKFTELENLHLTLKFLGEINEDKIDGIKKQLNEIKMNEFEASIGEIGVFSRKAPRILWIKLIGADILQKEIDECLKYYFEKEHRFMGHITIARIKYVKEKKEFNEYLRNLKGHGSFKVSKFIFKKSVLSTEGPEYSDIQYYPLLKEK